MSESPSAAPQQQKKEEKEESRVDHSQYDRPLATASEAGAGFGQDYIATLIDTLQYDCAARCKTVDACGECSSCEAATVIEQMADVIDDLVAALRGWQNYDLTLEQRQNAAMAAIAKAEGRRP